MSNKTVSFWYDRKLDRFNAQFVKFEPLDAVIVAEKVLTNDEYELLAMVADFDGLASEDIENLTVSLEDIDFVASFSEFDETNFAELYEKLLKA